MRNARRKIPEIAYTDIVDEVASLLVNRADAGDTIKHDAHSASLCQCNSRIPPGFRRIFTPAIDLETGNSRTVTCLVQPPDWRHMWAMPNENFRFGIVPRSVTGGTRISGFSRSIVTLRGP